MDFEVKIRGHRIDVRQVEQALRECALLKEAVVKAWSDGTETSQLVAYYIEKEPVQAEALREHLLAKLPWYMVPSLYIKLEQMPRLANGKLDRLS